MGMTIAEKIIAAAAGVESVKPGDIHTVQLDRLMSNDGTTHLTVDMYKNKLNHPHIADTKKLVFIVDHNVPSDCPKTAASQKKMRDFAKENNIDFAVDVYPHYGSDADVALTAGYDVRHGLIGAGVYASHGYERSHVDGVKNTFELLKAYLG